jgi:hypothetical protein
MKFVFVLYFDTRWGQIFSTTVNGNTLKNNRDCKGKLDIAYAVQRKDCFCIVLLV